MERTKVIEKIAKLKRHAESAKSLGSEAEAASFAAEVQRLCDEYHLSVEQIDLDDDPMREVDVAVAPATENPEDVDGRIAWWKADLGVIVADAHNCEVLTSDEIRAVWFVGRRIDRESAVWVYESLMRTMLEGARRVYRRAKFYGWTKGVKTEYFRGFLFSVQQRYDEQRRATRRGTDDERAVVLRKPNDEIARCLDEYGVEADPDPEGFDVPDDRNDFGFFEGLCDGRDAPIRSRGIDDGGFSRIQRIAEGDDG